MSAVRKAVLIFTGTCLLLLVLIVIIIIFVPEPEKTETAEVTPTVSPTAEVTPTVSPTPVATSISPPSTFTPQSLELLSAFHELLKFKDEPWFHVFCYSRNGPAVGWSEHVKSMDIRTLYDAGIAPGDLWGMGLEYCMNQGMETDDIRYWLRQMNPDWVNYRPIPDPKPVFAAPERPYQAISERLGTCIWNNPDLHSLLPEAIEASNNAADMGVFLEVVLDGSQDRSTLDGALNILVHCPR